MVLQGCKSTPQKSRPIESGHGRHAVQVANVCSYKLGQKMNFSFGWFLHGQSQLRQLQGYIWFYSSETSLGLKSNHALTITRHVKSHPIVLFQPG